MLIYAHVCALGEADHTANDVWRMQRVYGVSYPTKDLLDDYKHRMEEAKRRDHRNVGVQQQLFFFDRISPGSCFFLPNGARIYNQLIQVPALSSTACGITCVVHADPLRFQPC